MWKSDTIAVLIIQIVCAKDSWTENIQNEKKKTVDEKYILLIFIGDTHAEVSEMSECQNFMRIICTCEQSLDVSKLAVY